MDEEIINEIPTRPKKSILPWLIGILVVIIAIIGGYYYGTKVATPTTTSLITAARTTASKITTTTASNISTTTTVATKVINYYSGMRDVDLAKLIGINTKSGQKITNIKYEDFTSDNEDVVFNVDGGGTAGVTDIYIYGYRDKKIVELLHRTGDSLGYTLTEGMIKITGSDPNSTINKNKSRADYMNDINEYWYLNDARNKFELKS